jgi:hypothetical protein
MAAQIAAKARAKKLKADVETRWNSFFLLTQRLLDNRPHIDQILQHHPDARIQAYALSPLEWNCVGDLAQVLCVHLYRICTHTHTHTQRRLGAPTVLRGNDRVGGREVSNPIPLQFLRRQSVRSPPKLNKLRL